MLTLYRTLSLRYLQQRWSRAVLVVASIALGVATLVATRSLNQSMSQAARSAAHPLAGLADLYVSNGDAGVLGSLAADLDKVPGVRAAEPLVFGRARLPDLGEHHQAFVLGMKWKSSATEPNPWGVKIDWALMPDRLAFLQRNKLQTVFSKLGVRLRPVLIGNELDTELKGLPGDGTLERLLQRMGPEWVETIKTTKVRIQGTGQEPMVFIKAGTVKAENGMEDLVKNLLVMEAGDAADLLQMAPGFVTRIDVFLQPGSQREGVQDRLRDVVGTRAAVRTPESADQRVQDMLAGLQLGFALSGAGALVVGLFLVYNALTVSVAERRHEIGILRSLGATRGQIWALFVGEAALLGFLGVALGIPTGLGLAHLGLNPIQQVLSDFYTAMEAGRIEITTDTLVLAVVAGMATALVAALIPAIRAGNEEPARAVRRIPPVSGLGHRALQVTASLGLMTLGATCMVFRASLPGRVGTFGGFIVVLLGLLVAMPLLAAVLAHLLQPLARVMLGIEGRLAADNLVRAPGRTGLVITALAAGVTMFMQTAGVIRSNQEPILEWVNQALTADLVATSGSMLTGSGQNLLLPEDFGTMIQKEVPEVQAALPIRCRLVDFHDSMVYLVALDVAGFHSAERDRNHPLGWELYPLLAQPGPPKVIISRNFAALYHLDTGDSISLGGPRGPVKLEVIGTVMDYSCNRGTAIMDRNQYRKLFSDSLVDEFHLFLRPGTDPNAVRDKLIRRWEKPKALMVARRSEVIDHIKTQINRFAGIAYSQEIVVGLVAALGVVTALLISVLQRRRELGILRALGATRTQVLRSVLAEATLMGLIGAVIGLVTGVAVEWYNVQIILFEETGFFIPVRIPWAEAGLITGLALVTATLAGLGPALHALKLRIPEAIAYE